MSLIGEVYSNLSANKYGVRERVAVHIIFWISVMNFSGMALRYCDNGFLGSADLYKNKEHKTEL